jgi:hypothetical protein
MELGWTVVGPGWLIEQAGSEKCLSSHDTATWARETPPASHLLSPDAAVIVSQSPASHAVSNAAVFLGLLYCAAYIISCGAMPVWPVAASHAATMSSWARLRD